MTTKKLGSEPAYPLDGAGAPTGLTIRQEFAKAAMQGLMSYPHDRGTQVSSLAEVAVHAADALLAELQK